MRHVRALGLLFVLAVVCTGSLYAQSQATTGVIEGTVVDETGASLAGASVVVPTRPPTSSRRPQE
jgi:hypothetical protein